MKTIIKISLLLATFVVGWSCNYLDIAPEEIATVDHAFRNRNEARKYLYGCFSFMPNFADAGSNPAMFAGDEVFYRDPAQGMSPRLWHISLGNQGTVSPLANYYSSMSDGDGALQGGKHLLTALSDCNIFLENINKPYDLMEEERDRWIAEAKFLKAFYHFWLFRMYGPIPVIRENLPMSSPSSEVQRYREPVDDVINYIVELLDEAIPDLPDYIQFKTEELGRPDQLVALSLKAQALTYAASPLFNGNTDYSDYIDNRGVQLFPQTFDKEKWKRAADALKAAITFAHEKEHRLYNLRKDFLNAATVSDSTVWVMGSRGGAIEVEEMNPEIIWADYNSNTSTLQKSCAVSFSGSNMYTQGRNYSVPLKIVEQFYTNHGVPIEDDKDWVGVDPFAMRTATEDERNYIQENGQTFALHFDREPRFYGSLSFDRGTNFGNGRYVDNSGTNHNAMYVVLWQFNALNDLGHYDRSGTTGYWNKKMIHWRSSMSDAATDLSVYRYPYPIIRLGDLYLMYAEALNEYKAQPDTEVYEYIDSVRIRSGLEGVVASWSKYAIQPTKPSTQAGMREIIHRERLNELVFEGARFWDLKRWKEAQKYMDGVKLRGITASYDVVDLFTQSYSLKDYFWPIKTSTLTRNANLLQSPGW
jgi:hypothetical protein